MIVPLMIAIIALTGASFAHAQRAGFVVAGVPPVINSPVQPFITSPVGPFGVMPAITPPIISTFISPTHLNAGFVTAGIQPPQTVFIGPQFVPATSVIVPNHVIVPSTVFVAGPGSVIGPAFTVVGPVGPGSVVPAPLPVAPHFPAGTPRAYVLQQLGAPAVTIVTREGETLGFSNGTMVYIQNGVVVIR
jgi:hypothetical protein